MAATRPSSRGLGVPRTPGPGGKKSTVVAMRPSSRRPAVLRTPGSSSKEHVRITVSTMGPSSRELEAICVLDSRDKRTTPAPGAQRSAFGSDVLPVNAIGRMRCPSAPPLVSHLVRKVPGCCPLGLELGTDPYRIPGASVPEDGAGTRHSGDGRPFTSWPWSRRFEYLLHCLVGIVGHHGEFGQDWSARCCCG